MVHRINPKKLFQYTGYSVGVLVAITAVIFITLVYFQFPVPAYIKSSIKDQLTQDSQIKSVTIENLKFAIDRQSLLPKILVSNAQLEMKDSSVLITLRNGEVFFPWSGMLSQTSIIRKVVITNIEIQTLQSGQSKENTTIEQRIAGILNTIAANWFILGIEELSAKQFSFRSNNSGGDEVFLKGDLSLQLVSEKAIEGVWLTEAQTNETPLQLQFNIRMSDTQDHFALEVKGRLSSLFKDTSWISGDNQQKDLLENGTYVVLANFSPKGFKGSVHLRQENKGGVNTDTRVESEKAQFNFTYAYASGLLTMSDIVFFSSELGMEVRADFRRIILESSEQVRIESDIAVISQLPNHENITATNKWSFNIGASVTLPNQDNPGTYRIDAHLNHPERLLGLESLTKFNIYGFGALNARLKGNITRSGLLAQNSVSLYFSGHNNLGNESTFDLAQASFDLNYNLSEQKLNIVNLVINQRDWSTQLVADVVLQGDVFSNNRNIKANVDLFHARDNDQGLSKVLFGDFIITPIQGKKIQINFDLSRTDSLLDRVEFIQSQRYIMNPSGSFEVSFDNTFSPKEITGTLLAKSPLSKPPGNFARDTEISAQFNGKFQGKNFYLEEGIVRISPHHFTLTGELIGYTSILTNDFSGQVSIRSSHFDSNPNLTSQVDIGSLNASLNYSNKLLKLDAHGQASAVEFLLGWNSLQGSDQLPKSNSGSQFGIDLEVDIQAQKAHGKIEGGGITIPSRTFNENVVINQFQTEFSYDHVLGETILPTFRLNTNYFEVNALGTLFLPQFLSQSELQGNLEILELNSSNPTLFEQPLTGLRGGVDFSYLFNQQQLTIGQAFLIQDDVKLLTLGNLQFKQDGPHGSIDYKLQGLNLKNLIPLWPKTLFTKSRNWFAKNVTQLNIDEAPGGIIFSGQSPMILTQTLTYSDLEFTYLRGLPPIQGGSGYLSITNDDLSLFLEEGDIMVRDKGSIDIKGSRLYIPEMANSKIPSSIYLNIDGPSEPLLALLDYVPFEFLKKENIPQDIISSDVLGQVQITLPLIDVVTYELITLDGAGELKRVISKELALSKVMTAESLDVKYSDKGIQFTGDGLLGNVPVTLDWSKKFGTDSVQQSRVTGEIIISELALEEFNISFLQGKVSGSNPVEYTIQIHPDKPAQLELLSNLKDIKIDIPEINWVKPQGAEAVFQALIDLDNPIAISQLEFASDQISLAGGITFNDDNQPGVYYFDKLQVKDNYDGPLTVTESEDGSLRLEFAGKIGNLDFVNIAKDDSPKDYPPMSIFVNEIELTDELSLNQVEGQINLQNDTFVEFTSLVNDGAKINGKIERVEEQVQLTITSSQAGMLIEDAGLASKADGGAMELILRLNPQSEIVQGEVKINNLSFSVSQLIQAALESNNSEQEIVLNEYNFDFIGGQFYIQDSLIVIQNSSGFLEGSGISAQGSYDFESRKVDILGGVTFLSQLSTLMDIVFPIRLLLPTGNEDVLTLEYKASGNIDDLQIAINPIPKLTPALIGSFFFPSFIPIL